MAACGVPKLSYYVRARWCWGPRCWESIAAFILSFVDKEGFVQDDTVIFSMGGLPFALREALSRGRLGQCPVVWDLVLRGQATRGGGNERDTNLRRSRHAGRPPPAGL